MDYLREFTKGFWRENPIFRILLGLCPTLAVSTTVENAIGMGTAATFVLVCSNVLVSFFRRQIPRTVRIPAFIVIIATFVTIVDLMMAAFLPVLHKNLGIFVPLIVVNCIILGRAEAFASRNPVTVSAVDGMGMGLGFTFGLIALAAIRELLGSGTILGISVFGASFPPVIAMILPPGAFLALGLLLALMNWIEERSRSRPRSFSG